MEEKGKKQAQYTFLSKVKIQDVRNLVISKNNFQGGFTLAQQLIVQEASRKTEIFLKPAIHIKDLEALYSLRDALNDAINRIETGTI